MPISPPPTIATSNAPGLAAHQGVSPAPDWDRTSMPSEGWLHAGSSAELAIDDHQAVEARAHAAEQAPALATRCRPEHAYRRCGQRRRDRLALVGHDRAAVERERDRSAALDTDVHAHTQVRRGAVGPAVVSPGFEAVQPWLAAAGNGARSARSTIGLTSASVCGETARSGGRGSPRGLSTKTIAALMAWMPWPETSE